MTKRKKNKEKETIKKILRRISEGKHKDMIDNNNNRKKHTKMDD